jgi:hypothetical protein
MSTNVRTRWTLLLCVCINQNTNGTFIVVSQLFKNTLQESAPVFVGYCRYMIYNINIYIYAMVGVTTSTPDPSYDFLTNHPRYFWFFKLFPSTNGDYCRFRTAKVACYSLSDNFMKYLLRNSVFPIFILTAYLYFADLVQTSKL